MHEKVLIINSKFKINRLYWKMKMSWFTEGGWSLLNEIGKQIDPFIFVLTECPMAYVIWEWETMSINRKRSLLQLVWLM